MADYYELFGIEKPAGANEPEIAAPAESPAGANEPEVAEPASEGTLLDDVPATEITEKETQAENSAEADGASATPEDHKTQSKEERARNAARRREREKQQLREDLRREWEAEKAAETKATEDSIIAGLGMSNPYTGEVIATREDFEQYQRQVAEERDAKLDRELRKSGLQRDTLNELVASSPKLRQAVSAVEEVKAELQQEKAKVSSQQRLSSELEKISQLDPAIKTLDDLREKPYISQMTEMIRKGYSLSDAYRLSTENERLQAALAKTKQSTINNIGGKEHHQPTTAQAGQTLVSVPREIARYYQMFNPGATPEEIKKHYNANLKR